MRHPKRSITRDIRTRRPLHPGRGADERDALQWPEAGISVADYMTRSPATIHSDALVRGVVDMMQKRKIRHLPVVDREGHLVGIVTDRNLRQVIFDPAIQDRLGDLADVLNTLTVRDVMTWGGHHRAPGGADPGGRPGHARAEGRRAARRRRRTRHRDAHGDRRAPSVSRCPGPGSALEALPLGAHVSVRTGDREGAGMAEAIRDQWVIVAATIGVVILLIWLVLTRRAGGRGPKRR
jgi:CBS domain-containing protein